MPLIILLCLLFLGQLTAVAAEPPDVALLSDFQSDSALMSDKGYPMVVEMSAEGCTYCEQIEKFVLKPLIMSGEYEDRILLRKVDINASEQVLDLDGSTLTQSSFADRYNVYLTPTLIFLDQEGNEIAPRMIGVPLIDFYGAYLDQAIDIARKAMKN